MSIQKLLPTIGTALVIVGATAFAEHLSGPAASEAKPIKATFLVTGLHCPPCARTVESSLQGLKGVLEVNVDWKTKTAKIEFDESRLPAQQVSRFIAATPHMMGGSLHYGGWLTLKAAEIKDEAAGKKAEEALRAVEGVKNAKAYVEQHSIAVRFSPEGAVKTQQLIDSLKQAGFEAENY